MPQPSRSVTGGGEHRLRASAPKSMYHRGLPFPVPPSTGVASLKGDASQANAHREAPMKALIPAPTAGDDSRRTSPAIVRNRRPTLSLFAPCLLILAACGTEPMAPSAEADVESAALFAKGGHPDLTPQCATDPDFVVTTDTELRNAMIASFLSPE